MTAAGTGGVAGAAGGGRTAVRPIEIAAVAAGGVLGAEARLGVGQLLPPGRAGFPWSTVLVNATGCLLVGAMVAVLVARAANPLVRLFLVVGVLGGYTTFSAYSVDAVQLVEAGRPALAITYVALTLALALRAVTLGGTLARAVLGIRGVRGDGPGRDVGGEV